MARNAATAIENNFTAGFVTQATALNFPPNAAFEQDNVVFSERGIVQRRNGFDYENNFVEFSESDTEKAQATYYWKNSGGDGNVNLVVHQNGATLHFYDTNRTISLSGGKLVSTISLSSFQSTGSTLNNLNQNECQFSAGLGYLFVVHPYCDPFYVKYNIGTDTFTSSVINFQIRDLVGVEENVLVDNRPTVLNDAHKYNLLNQGWDNAKYNTFFAAASSRFPSNADVWWIFKDSTDTYNPGTTLASNSRGSSPAPKGFFRVNPWNTARNTVALNQSGNALSVGAFDETSGSLRPSVTEFHSGRVFYAGVNVTGYNSRIYFSKIVQKPSDFGQCMSDNDPTSETLFDFLPSDGGIIAIPQAGTIFRLVSLGPYLLVFGANGVWAIAGNTGIGFTATDYTVSSVSDERSISGTSFIMASGAVAWWNNTGINIVQNDPRKGLSIESMTNDKIKDFYLSIPSNSRRFARGTYNPRTKTMQWMYRSDSSASLSETYRFDSILSFNTLIGAFYTWTVPDDIVALRSVVTIEGAGSLVGVENIVDNLGNIVTNNLGDPLQTYGFTQTTVTTTTKFLVYNNGKFSFSECFNVNYKDWTQKVVGGVDYESYFITGYRLSTQGGRHFQTNYVYVFSDLEDGANSYRFQALWDYGNSGNTGQWTQLQLITHNESNYDASRRRLKVRGSGSAVQFKFRSVSGMPFNIVGWSTYETANQSP